MWMQRPVTESLLGIGAFPRDRGHVECRCQRPSPRTAAPGVGGIASEMDRAGSPGQLPPLLTPTEWFRNPRRILTANVPRARRSESLRDFGPVSMLWNRPWKSAVSSSAPESVWIARIASTWSVKHRDRTHRIRSREFFPAPAGLICSGKIPGPSLPECRSWRTSTPGSGTLRGQRTEASGSPGPESISDRHASIQLGRVHDGGCRLGASPAAMASFRPAFSWTGRSVSIWVGTTSTRSRTTLRGGWTNWTTPKRPESSACRTAPSNRS